MNSRVRGGLKAAKTNKQRHGKDFYKKIGKMGGSVKRRESRYFFMHPEVAKAAGKKSKRNAESRWMLADPAPFEEGFNKKSLIDKLKERMHV